MAVAKSERTTLRGRKNRRFIVDDVAYRANRRETHRTDYARDASGVWVEITSPKASYAVRVLAVHIDAIACGTGERITFVRVTYTGNPVDVADYLRTVPMGDRAELTDTGAIREFAF